MKRLIVCCDGTWQSEDEASEAPTADASAALGWSKSEAPGSNVWKLRCLLADRDANGIEQRAFYQAGVGTDQSRSRLRREASRWLGGILGWGLDDNIIEAYQWLVREYEPGDSLWLFGFSRGAYTARSLTGLIRNCGILRREHQDQVMKAMKIYRSRDPGAHPDAPQSRSFRGNYSHRELNEITFLGVWDTVGALGVPDLLGRRLSSWVNRRHRFHDVELSSMVRNARHALAIDERRPSFQPAVWRGRSLENRPEVKQVWFAGVHCDIGGGYRETELSDRTLRWMLAEATQCGLAIHEDLMQCKLPDPPETSDPAALCVPLHDSRWCYHKWFPSIAQPREITPGDRQFIHASARQMLDQCAEYKPENLRKALEGGMPVIGEVAAEIPVTV